MDLADQPFFPINLANELMTRTGEFADGRQVTTIMIVDENTQTLQLQKDEDNYVAHLESLADQVLQFGDDQRKRLANPPLLSFKCGQSYPTMN